jgi:RHS repeat-associated protein
LGHPTTYAYDGAFRLTKVTDGIGKITEYTYDSFGRVTRAGAGAGGVVDPTKHYFDNITGQLSKVEFVSSVHAVNYWYDGEARLTQITDWLDGTDGLRYEYDDVGRLTTLKDYDNSTLNYVYDDAGSVITMTDYHGNSTSYTYNAIGKLSSLTAPGGKTWTYSYGTGARLTRVDIPNGMYTLYGYDVQGRQTSIHHKDGATIKQGFDYAFDTGGNITKVTHEDGTYWEYDYDGRDRLILAERGNHTAPTILATYEYTYDDGDNLLTKVVPWCDDFEDGNITGWSGSTGYFSVSSGVMKNTSDASVRELYLTETDADHDLSLEYVRYSTTGRADVVLRTVGGNDQLYLEINPTNLRLRQVDGGTLSTLVTYNTTVAEDVWYTLRAILDGTSVKIYWGAEGADFNEIISATTTKTTTVRAAYVKAQANSEHGFDNIQLIAGSRSTVETFTYNNANEQTAHGKNGVTTTMAYDAWGRLTSRDDGTHDAAYSYRYGSKLYSVTSDFPGEGNVTYETGGDGNRRSRVAGGVETWFNWATDEFVISEEDNADGASGALSRTYIGSNLAHVDGSSPVGGSWKYYGQDHLGSTTEIWNQDKTLYAAMEWDAYGSAYGVSGATNTVTHRYGGFEWDEVSGLYYSLYRYYSPGSARWLTRDPLGLVDGLNVYAYVRGNPIRYSDPLGLFSVTPRAVCIAAAVLGAAVIVGAGFYFFGPAVLTWLAAQLARKAALRLAQATAAAGFAGGFLWSNDADAGKSKTGEGGVKKLKPHKGTKNGKKNSDKHTGRQRPGKDKKRQHEGWCGKSW